MQDSNSFSSPGLMPQIAPLNPSWRWVGERGLRVETGDATLARYAVLAARHSEIEDVIPADGSLLLVLRRGAGLSPELYAALTAPLPSASRAAGTLHEIAVEYGGVVGPDLAALAQQAGMSTDRMIERHTAAEYTVAFLGFQPGFPYLIGLPSALHVPRRAVPRVSAAGGSVAIGGAYTGIYPAAGPAGWHVIGRTNAVLFDPRRDAPALLMPGDRVRFLPE